MNIGTIREFLGWCTVINFGLLVLASIMLVAFRGAVGGIHRRMFGLDEASLQRAYFGYLANYKIAIIVLNLVPYLALRIMG